MINLTQLLCPHRHCISAMPWDSSAFADNQAAESELIRLVQYNGIPWRCGICGSTQLQCETGTTPFKTMEEAMPDLRAAQLAQTLLKAGLDVMGETWDSRAPSRN
jgi:hypothetical protein